MEIVPTVALVTSSSMCLERSMRVSHVRSFPCILIPGRVVGSPISMDGTKFLSNLGPDHRRDKGFCLDLYYIQASFEKAQTEWVPIDEEQRPIGIL